MEEARVVRVAWPGVTPSAAALASTLPYEEGSFGRRGEETRREAKSSKARRGEARRGGSSHVTCLLVMLKTEFSHSRPIVNQARAR